MERTFEAVYENGVLRPLETLPISNMEHVLLTISDVPATAADVAGYSNLTNGKPQNMTTLDWTRFGAPWRRFLVRSRTQ